MTSVSQTFWKEKTVLVTGHTGFIGSWLVATLSKLGAHVTGVALSPDSPSHYEIIAPHISIVSQLVDIRNQEKFTAAITNIAPQIVFHLAAESLVRRAYTNPVETFSANVMGTVHLLEALRNVEAFRAAVIMTTDKVYLNNETANSFHEEDKLGGVEPYGASKACSEIVTEAYRASYFSRQGKGLATVRAGNVIGGGDFSTDRLIPDYVRAVISGNGLHLRYPGARRPWQFVMEPVLVCLLLAEKLYAQPDKWSEAWNIGPENAKGISVRELIGQVQNLWGESSPSVTYAASADAIYEAQLLSIDSSKIREHLEWKPAKTFERGLEATVQWYKTYQAGEDPAKMTLRHIEEWLQ